MEVKFKEGDKVVNRNGCICSIVNQLEDNKYYIDDFVSKYSYVVSGNDILPYYPEEELPFVNDDSRIEQLKKTPIDPREFGKPDNKTTILDEAKEIVDSLRGQDYYDPVKNFRDISVMASLMTGKTFSPSDCVKVLMAVKLTRESFKHKRDSLVDLCGYTYILDKIEES